MRFSSLTLPLLDVVAKVTNHVLVNEGKNPEVPRGRICLQSEGTEIHFKDIELQPLD